MQAQIFKDNYWRDLRWVAGQDPVVTNQVESRIRLFEFQAPRVQFRIYADIEPRFKPGGEWEVERGDEVRVYCEGERVFQGIIDRDIRWDKRMGVLTFKASGWIARINQMLAGRATNYFTDDRYRYRRMDRPLPDDESTDENESEIEYEYIAIPQTFETLWDDDLIERVGYKKKYLFDTRGLVKDDVFQHEISNSLYEAMLPVHLPAKVYRRRMDRGTLFNVTFTELINELMLQINHELGDEYLLGTVEPGVITSDNPVVIPLLEDIKFIYAVFNAITLNNETNYYAIGFPKGGESKWLFAANAKIYKIISQVDVEERAEVSFSGTDPKLHFNEQPPEIKNATDWNNLNGWGLRRYVMNNGNIVILQMWSWLEMSINSRQRQTSFIGQRHATAEWFIINPHTKEEILHRTLHLPIPEPDRQIIRGNIEELDRLLLHLPLYRSFVFNSDEFVYGEFSFDSDQQDTKLEANGGVYSLENEWLAFTGPLSIQNVAFSFENMGITKILVEIAKLTNSIFYIDNDKRINIVSRNYFHDVAPHKLTRIIRSRRNVYDNYGGNAPRADSAIVKNETYNQLLNDYYVDEYFAAKEDSWELMIPVSSANAGIGLLDPVLFDEIGLGADVTPAIVREVELRDDEIRLTVTRAR